jgi:hypothetical protein
MELDASLVETHQASATITQNEIESGSNVNDHIILSPEKLVIEGVVSQTPLGISGLIGSAGSAIAGAAGAAIGGIAGTVATAAIGSIGGLVASAISSRDPKDVFTYLMQLRDERIPFQIVTALKSYENMVLIDLNVPRNIQNVNILKFTATFEKIKIVSANIVSIGGVGAGAGAGGIANIGQQATSAVSAATEEGSSILFSIFN